jgi:hypothetical protein
LAIKAGRRKPWRKPWMKRVEREKKKVNDGIGAMSCEHEKDRRAIGVKSGELAYGTESM